MTGREGRAEHATDTPQCLLNVENVPARPILVERLLPADSPRLGGEDMRHVRMLIESEADLPPIIVHLPTMRVIDGMHRVHAASALGVQFIDARFYSGDEEDAFALAVRSNVLHGLPLSLADRRQAAVRIMRSHPAWSDRAVASVAGLAPKTIRAIRCSNAEVAQSNVRIGRDGRSRPTDAAARRARAREVLARHPEASLRQVAKEVGIAPSTVREIRRSMNGEDSRADAVPESPESSLPPPPAAEPGGWCVPEELAEALRVLKSDPSLRFNEAGRALIRLLGAGPATEEQGAKIADMLPAHCVALIASLARQRGAAWYAFAWLLDEEKDRSDPGRSNFR